MQEVFIFLHRLSEICDVLSIRDEDDYNEMFLLLQTSPTGTYLMFSGSTVQNCDRTGDNFQVEQQVGTWV